MTDERRQDDQDSGRRGLTEDGPNATHRPTARSKTAISPAGRAGPEGPADPDDCEVPSARFDHADAVAAGTGALHSPADPDNPVDPDSQADSDNPADPDSPADPDNQADQADPAGAATGPARSPSPLRQTGFVVARALVVLVVAAVAYQAVVPNVVVVRGRLARLVLSKPGVPAYDKTKAQSGEQNDAQTGLAAVTAAAQQSPDKTGIYSIEWSPSQDSGAGMIANPLSD